jgi:hypothetical protein
MPRLKGSGKKSKLSVTIDTDIVTKLDERFKNDPGEKSRFVNWILRESLNNYLIMLDRGGLAPTVAPVVTKKPEIILEVTKSRENL